MLDHQQAPRGQQEHPWESALGNQERTREMGSTKKARQAASEPLACASSGVLAWENQRATERSAGASLSGAPWILKAELRTAHNLLPGGES